MFTLQTKVDQDELDLESLKHSMDESKSVDKQREKLAALEIQLSASTAAANSQDTAFLFGNEVKETDLNIKSTPPGDVYPETVPSNVNVNSNGDRAQIAQPKVINQSIIPIYFIL